MSDDAGYEVIEELDIEEVVPQIDDFHDDVRDTAPMAVPSFRAQTSSDWPPAPPLPADVDLAQGTLTEGEPVRRNAGFYAVVRRPTTSSETD
jgi:hypothetical protein